MDGAGHDDLVALGSERQAQGGDAAVGAGNDHGARDTRDDTEGRLDLGRVRWRRARRSLNSHVDHGTSSGRRTRQGNAPLGCVRPADRRSVNRI